MIFRTLTFDMLVFCHHLEMIIDVVEDKNPIAKNGSTPLSLAKDPSIRNLILKRINDGEGEVVPRRKQKMGH